jgi:hypothetical protein
LKNKYELNIIPETNKYYSNIYSEDFVYIPRIYGGLNGVKTLVEKDGSNYKGYLKTFKIGSQIFTLTENGRWFDNSGMPCQCPKSVKTKEKLTILKAELNRLDGEKKWQDYKNKVFKNRR